MRARPAYAEAQYNLGVARDALGKKPEAVVDPEQAKRNMMLGLLSSQLMAEAKRKQTKG